MKPQLVETYSATVRCCTFERSGLDLGDVVRSLLRHIRAKHPELRKRVENAAMRVARRQNGQGYYDVRGEGWRKEENKTWKEAIREQALEEMLKGMTPSTAAVRLDD